MPKLKKKDLQGVYIIVGVLSFLGTIFGASLMLDDSRRVNEATLCPLSGSEKRTVVIVDKSDKWDAGDRTRVKNLLDQVYREVPPYGRLVVVAIAGKGRQSTRVDELFNGCNPGSEEECNALYENCRRIRATYEKKFEEKVVALDEILTKPGQASYSPLFETVVQHIDDNRSPKLEIHLVSDLMENGARFRFYDVVPLPEEVIETYPIESSAHIEVEIHLVERRRHSRGLIDSVTRVWESYFEDQGINVRVNRLLIAN